MPDNNRIGLIAGNRRLPFHFAEWAKRGGRDLYIAGIKGEVDENLKKEVPPGRYREFYVTELTQMIRFFNAHEVDEAVMIGGIARAKLKFNLDMIKIALRLLFVKNKHKGVFALVMSMFDNSGVKIRAIQDLMPELLIGEGGLGRVKPSDRDIAALKGNLGAILDYTRTGRGQAVVIHNGGILAYEGFKGTDDIIARAAAKRRKAGGERGGMMVKIMEPGQDSRADLPVVGTETILTLAKHGIDGVVVEAGRAITDDMAETVRLADEKGVFVYGVKVYSSPD